MRCYRNINQAELDLLKSNQDVIGRCKLEYYRPYVVADKKIYNIPVVCFFKDYFIWPHENHTHYVECEIPDEDIICFGKGRYDYNNEVHFKDELYVRKYNIKNVTKIII